MDMDKWPDESKTLPINYMSNENIPPTPKTSIFAPIELSPERNGALLQHWHMQD